ncbi:hypothetical protein ARHIZOSPH14_20270 [Agromyces rhizosphaerae]|uniref:DUF1648 domain-containing protein n=1 Tax=Agromyces rhizosphaerae TaxID=88374 RepID=A0A9W6CY37_9MICO|nr:DUF1648 domain-containing protein [Agromyces rhizosphaerae]GLI27785.1 hypothetical protein ARHIZOSPH14_20270 [Agromyces rhizosphaerae]
MTTPQAIRPEMSASMRRARSRLLVVTIAVPAVLVAVAVALQLTWLPELPEIVATHWSGSEPDAFGPAWTYPALTVAIGLGVPALLAAVTVPQAAPDGFGTITRLLGALMLGLATLITVSMTWAVAMQRGLDDAADATGIGLPLLAAAAAGVVAGVVAWFVQPATELPEPEVEPGAPIELEPGERAVWVRTTTVATPALVAIIAAIVLVVGLAAILGVTSGARTWALWIAAGAMALAATTLAFRVRVDATGVTARSLLGLLRFRVPIEQVRRAEVVQVRAMAEFGGIGVRLAPQGRFGIVLHSGTALQVHREGGRIFTVTVEDAATAAGLLSALQRAR